MMTQAQADKCYRLTRKYMNEGLPVDAAHAKAFKQVEREIQVLEEKREKRTERLVELIGQGVSFKQAHTDVYGKPPPPKQKTKANPYDRVAKIMDELMHEKGYSWEQAHRKALRDVYGSKGGP